MNIPNDHSVGVYAIVNTKNSRFYIGSTSYFSVSSAGRRIGGFRKRGCDHRSYLRRGVHHCRFLQRDWDSVGEAFFEFRILEVCSDEEATAQSVLDVEDIWLASTAHTYNSMITTQGSPRVPLSKEHRDKMSAAKKGKCSPAMLAANRRIAAAKKGVPHAPNHAAKIAAANRSRAGRTVSPETKEKLRLANIGSKHSAATRAKMSTSHLGHLVRPETTAKIVAKKAQRWIVVTPSNEKMEIVNMSNFCRENGLSPGLMSQVASGTRRHHKGYTCKAAS